VDYKFPHIALNIMSELASRKGDCRSAILSTATDLGFEAKQYLLDSADFACGSESALASILDKPTYDGIIREVAKRESEGSLLPCQVSPGQTVSSCVHKCPLLMDLLLQADGSNPSAVSRRPQNED
jgi:hypothetical protein